MEIFSFEQEAQEAIQPALQSTQALPLPLLPAQVVLRVLELAVVQQVVEQQEQVVNHHPLRRMERMGEVFHQGLLVAVLLDQKRRIEKINSLVLVHI